MVRVEIKAKGIREFASLLERMDLKEHPEILRRGLIRTGDLMVKTVRTKYLRGPRPGRLVSSGRVANSIAIDTSDLPNSIAVGPDPNLWWLQNYEIYGGVRGKRPFLRPALFDVVHKLPEIMQEEWEDAGRVGLR